MTKDGEQNILRFIGLAARAGKAVSGAGACEENLRAGKAKLLIVAKDIARNSMDARPKRRLRVASFAAMQRKFGRRLSNLLADRCRLW